MSSRSQVDIFMASHVRSFKQVAPIKDPQKGTYGRFVNTTADGDAAVMLNLAEFQKDLPGLPPMLRCLSGERTFQGLKALTGLARIKQEMQRNNASQIELEQFDTIAFEMMEEIEQGQNYLVRQEFRPRDSYDAIVRQFVPVLQPYSPNLKAAMRQKYNEGEMQPVYAFAEIAQATHRHKDENFKRMVKVCWLKLKTNPDLTALSQNFLQGLFPCEISTRDRYWGVPENKLGIAIVTAAVFLAFEKTQKKYPNDAQQNEIIAAVQQRWDLIKRDYGTDLQNCRNPQGNAINLTALSGGEQKSDDVMNPGASSLAASSSSSVPPALSISAQFAQIRSGGGIRFVQGRKHDGSEWLDIIFEKGNTGKKAADQLKAALSNMGLSGADKIQVRQIGRQEAHRYGGYTDHYKITLSKLPQANELLSDQELQQHFPQSGRNNSARPSLFSSNSRAPSTPSFALFHQMAGLGNK